METTISSKYQVVIPKAIRKQINLREGQALYVYGLADSIILSPKPRSYTQKMLGLGREIWKDIDPLQFIRQERQVWSKKISE